MVQHREIPALEIHRLVNWEFPTQAERDNAIVTSGDLFKLAYQQNNNQFYILLNTTPSWLQLLSEGSVAPPTGIAGGDLTGTYPNPSISNDSHNHTPGISIPSYPTTLPPSGPATGADIIGNYPAPELSVTGVTPGVYNRATVTVDNKGRITNIGANTDPTTGGSPFPGFNNVNLTGIPTAPTTIYQDSSTKIATTEYITKGQIRQEELPAGELLTILPNRQKVVHKSYIVNGTLTIRGRFIIASLPSTEVEANFRPPNANVLEIPANYFKIVMSGYRVASPIHIYGTLKIL